eukprot:CAMPEP_0178913244 /NCGR_PEP_ID=MMETSP0786-20121207/10732_1 /TAXON_ID=186022 /ORGANISM="Thalassionema frauenfeldii, Strain CCMP 1798" /LENGTH=163 /DNA_ID=CAMNT_0020585959 /DNA_START=517 /DNA_END=1008 /DNA_ORIENTATION=-
MVKESKCILNPIDLLTVEQLRRYTQPENCIVEAMAEFFFEEGEEIPIEFTSPEAFQSAATGMDGVMVAGDESVEDKIASIRLQADEEISKILEEYYGEGGVGVSSVSAAGSCSIACFLCQQSTCGRLVKAGEACAFFCFGNRTCKRVCRAPGEACKAGCELLP